jgi:hypothetical protein
MDTAGVQQSELIYIEQVKAMRDYELTTLYVDHSHLLEREDVLARAISDQYYRYASSIRLRSVSTYHLDSFPIFDVLCSISSGNMTLPISTSTPLRPPLQTPGSKFENSTSPSTTFRSFLVSVSFELSASALSYPSLAPSLVPPKSDQN